MSEAGQRQRSKRPTAIDMMHDQTVWPQEHTRNPINVLRSLPPVRATDRGRDHIGGQFWRGVLGPCDSDRSQSLRPIDFEVAQSRHIYEDIGSRTADSTEMGRSILQRRLETYRSEAPTFTHVERAPLHSEGHGSAYRGAPIRDPKDHPVQRPLPSSHSTMSDDQRLSMSSNNYHNATSRPVNYYPPISNIGEHRFNNSYQQPAHSASIELYPAVHSPISTTRPLTECIQNLQPPQAPQKLGGGNQPLFSPPLGPETRPSPLTLAPPLAQRLHSQRDLKFKKLCNNKHLRGACILGDSCRYTHGTISQAELKELKRIAKGVVCKYGLGCDDELCYAGHKCPYNCTGYKCQFPAEMHYDGPEESRGREVMKTERHQESYWDGDSSRHGNNESLVSSRTNQSKTSHKETPPLTLQYDESETPPARERRRSDREMLKREVDELMDEVAPWRNSQPEPRRGMFPPPPREASEREIDLFEESLARSHMGSQASSPPGRRPDIRRYSSSGRSQASSHGEHYGERRSWRQSGASSYGYDRGHGRSFRVGKKDSWRPEGGSRRH